MSREITLLLKIHTTYRENVQRIISDVRKELESCQDLQSQNTKELNYYYKNKKSIIHRKYNSVRHVLLRDFITASGQELGGVDTFSYEDTSELDRFRIYHYMTDYANIHRSPELVRNHWSDHNANQNQNVKESSCEFIHV
jgi:hypothetical protein